MLRWLARTAVILVFAALVAGGIYLGVRSRGPSTSGDRFGQWDERSSAAFADRAGHGRGRRDGRSPGGREGRGRESASLGHGLAGVAGTALQIGCVGAVVAGLQKGWRRRQRRR